MRKIRWCVKHDSPFGRVGTIYDGDDFEACAFDAGAEFTEACKDSVERVIIDPAEQPEVLWCEVHRQAVCHIGQSSKHCHRDHKEPVLSCRMVPAWIVVKP